LFQILKSEGEKIKHIKSPARDRKYAIVAFSQLILDTINEMPDESLQPLIRALIDLCYEGNKAGGF
jgi:hypothetical protein